MLTANPFGAVDKQWVIGTLKATGSTDADVLYAARVKLLDAVGAVRFAGVALGGLGAAILVPGIWRWAGPPLIVAGWWLWRRGTQNRATVEAGFAEFIATDRRRPR